MSLTTPTIESSEPSMALYMGIDLAEKRWAVAFSVPGRKVRSVSVDRSTYARDLPDLVAQMKRHFGLSPDTPVFSCYEAGRDGFWVHRYFASIGIANVVVDPASIETPRKARQAKTDRLDARKLVRLLIRFRRGDEDVWRICRVPSPEAEDDRRISRHLQALKGTRTRLGNQIRSALAQVGASWPTGRVVPPDAASLRQWDGSELPPHLAAEVDRLGTLHQAAHASILEIEGQRRARVNDPTDQARPVQQVRKLQRLRGLADSSWVLVDEFYGWREFRNRRQIGGLAGLTGTPFNTGGSAREQGISKAGNARVRSLAVELAWLWLRYQPQSDLSRWYRKRFGGQGRRERRRGIVALARKLLVAWWRYLEHDEIPAGAVLT